MRIERGKVVTLAYELRDARGEPLEDADASLAYLHGYGGIFPKVEEALSGKDVGHELSLTLEPEDAFGEYDADLLRVEPRDRFPEALEVGMQFEGVPGDSDEEARIYTITTAGRKHLQKERREFDETIAAILRVMEAR